MTHFIIARCVRTGSFGLAIASRSANVGFHCHGATRANVGVVLTIGSPRPTNNAFALNLLALGYTAGHALAELKANDPNHESCTIAIIDREGITAAHSGAAQRARGGGHAVGDGHVVAGHALPGDGLLRVMANAYEAVADAALDVRLLRALESAREHAAAAQRVRSCALIVQGPHAYTDVDLRIEMQEDAVAELRRLYDEYQPYAAYYDERGKQPRNAIPQREFADILNAQEAPARS
jgi:uncharacterized Ntn-hydrolase superfamily protein